MFEKIKQIASALLGLTFLGLAIWFGVEGHVGTMATAIMAGLACLFFSHITKFKRIKMTWFEAELWDDKQEEAAQLIDRLNHLAAATAHPIYSMLAVQNDIFGVIGEEEVDAMVAEIDQTLLRAGISQADMNRLKDDVHRSKVRSSIRPMSNLIKSKTTVWGNELMAKVGEFSQPFSSEDAVTVEELRSTAQFIFDLGNDVESELASSHYIEVPIRVGELVDSVPRLTEAQKSELHTLISPHVQKIQSYIERCKLPTKVV